MKKLIFFIIGHKSKTVSDIYGNLVELEKLTWFNPISWAVWFFIFCFSSDRKNYSFKKVFSWNLWQ